MKDLVIINENGLLNPEVAKQIVEFEKQAKAIEEAQTNLKKRIKEEMEKNGIIKLETDDLRITYVDETYSENFDNTKFRNENEELYNKYIKLSKKSSYITFKVK